jgi:aldose 1-epimerase
MQYRQAPALLPAAFLLCAALTAAAAPGAAVAAAAARYTAARDGDVVRLADGATQTTVAILPSVGNIAFDFTVRGQGIVRFPFASVAQFQAAPVLTGMPFLGPFANRLDEPAFWANGVRHPFDLALGNIRGSAVPIHGFLSTTNKWQVVEIRADAKSAWVTSRLDVFREPAWMAQWPFAHTVEMTYRLQDGALEVHTAIHNLANEPMPVAIGFHPYFQLTDSNRDDWTLSVAARRQWPLTWAKLPSGDTRPIEQFFPDPAAVQLRDFALDHVFDDLVRDADGRATMSVKGAHQRLDIVFGPNFRAVVIFAPRPPAGERGYICIEPMAGITNALNLAHAGVYKDLQSIAPGGTWQESFWVRPSGF